MQIVKETSWIEGNAGLWGLLALPIAVLLAFPAILQFIMTIRDGRKTTDELHAVLRSTRGRVSGSGFQNGAIGTHSILPLCLKGPDTRSYQAVEYVYDRIATGIPVIIEGQGGSGKSQVLQNLHQYSYKIADSPKDPLIEVVTLGGMEVTKTSNAAPLEVAARQIARRYRMSRSAIRALMAEAKLLVAFDGLDEMGPDSQAEAVEHLIAAAKTHPIVVTSRPLNSKTEWSPGPLQELVVEGRMLLLKVEPLEWKTVRSELDAYDLPVPKVLYPQERADFGNPLYLQMLLFLWQEKRIDRKSVLEVFNQPDRLFSFFVSNPKGAQSAKDRALYLGAIMSADHEKYPGVPTRLLPLQLGSIAFRLTYLATFAVLFFVGWFNELPASVLIFGLAVLWSSPYGRDTFLGRATSLWSGQRKPFLELILTVITSLAVVQLARIVVWSLQTGQLEIGSWGDLTSLYWLQLSLAFWLYVSTSPMSLEASIASITRYQQRRLWPHFALLTFLVIGIIAQPPFLYLPLLQFWALYIVQTCIYLLISMGLAWMISDIPPWKWKAAMDSLVHRGILSRDGSAYKYTHSRIEQQILWMLVNDSRTPRLLWSIFGVEWAEKLLNEPVGTYSLKLSVPGMKVIAILGRKYAWSPSLTNLLYCYYQWIVIQPHEALTLIRRHLRMWPRSTKRQLLPDALDRMGYLRGPLLAHRQLHRKGVSSSFTAYWNLVPLQRRYPYAHLIAVIQELLKAHPDPSEATNRFLRHQLSLCVVRTSDTASTQTTNPLDKKLPLPLPLVDHARIALEQSSPDLDRAEQLLGRAQQSSLRCSRLAQLALLRSDLGLASKQAVSAIRLLTTYEGYDTVLEVMLTASALGADPFAKDWLERAYASGLRLRGRSGLERNLGLLPSNWHSCLFVA